MKRMIVALCIAILAACATPEGMKKIGRTAEVVYEVPVNGVDDNTLFSGISFKTRRYDCVRDGFRYVRDTRIAQRGNDQCEVTFMTSIIPEKGGAESTSIVFKSYIFKVARSTKHEVTRIEFKPLYEVLEPPATISKEKVSPPHTLEDAMEVIATSGTFTFQFEIDSSFRPAVVRKKFRKYFKELVHVRHPVQVMKKSFGTSYLLSSGGNHLATIYLTLSPLKKGTRATVIAMVKLAPDINYHIDAFDQAKDIKKLIADAISE